MPNRDDELIGSVLSNAASQLRGSLGNIYSAFNRIVTREMREGNPELDKNAALLYQSYYRMLRLVNNLTNAAELYGQWELPMRNGDIVELCRRICREKPPLDEAQRLLQEVKARPDYSAAVKLAVSPMTGFFFCLFYGGGLSDAVWAGLCSVALRLLLWGLERLRVNSFFCNLLGGALSGGVAMAAVSLGLAQNADTIIIGVLMNLVPGIVITTFMRDMMAGDVVAGLIRFCESLLVATAIALGVGAALMVPRLLFGV